MEVHRSGCGPICARRRTSHDDDFDRCTSAALGRRKSTVWDIGEFPRNGAGVVTLQVEPSQIGMSVAVFPDLVEV